MPKTPNDRLSIEEIRAFLSAMSGWSYDPGTEQIEKTFTCKNFMDAVALIQRIAPIAERMDHHPDLLLSGYKNVRVMLSTHSAQGITQNDLDLAKAVEEVL